MGSNFSIVKELDLIELYRHPGKGRDEACVA